VTRVRALLRKEWLELRSNRVVVGTSIATPILMSLLAVATSATMERILEASPPDSQDGFPFALPPELSALGSAKILVVLLNDQMLTMILFVPTMVPMTIATQSVIGDKTIKALEPTLATPVRISELLVSKVLAALVPAIVLGWTAYAVAIAGIAALNSGWVLAWAARPAWILCMLAVGPLLGAIGTSLGVLVSSRSNDPRTAQGAGVLLILPILGFGVSSLLGMVVLRVDHVLMACALLFPIAISSAFVAVRLFGRETILTRWK
jgi:ABC-2 type transport system permease protein